MSFDDDGFGFMGVPDFEFELLSPSVDEGREIDRLTHRRKQSKCIRGGIRTHHIQAKLFEGPPHKVGVTSNEILLLCRQAIQHWRHFPNVLELESPICIVGDLHGSDRDLMTILLEMHEKPSFENRDEIRYLFLGDYLDRGDNSLRVILLLFSLACQYKTSVYTLRGNHETKNATFQYGFYDECLDSYGPEEGREIFFGVLHACRWLPLAAVVNRRVFCCHGGIGPDIKTLDDIHGIQRTVHADAFADPRLSQLLWSDPSEDLVATQEAGLRQQAMVREQQQQQQQQHGEEDSVVVLPEIEFLPGGWLSSPRGCGVAWALEHTKAFLKRNSIEWIVRAHEVCSEGIMLNHKGTVVTVFSSSRYCGNCNKAAILLIQRDGSVVVKQFSSQFEQYPNPSLTAPGTTASERLGLIRISNIAEVNLKSHAEVAEEKEEEKVGVRMRMQVSKGGEDVEMSESAVEQRVESFIAAHDDSWLHEHGMSPESGLDQKEVFVKTDMQQMPTPVGVGVGSIEREMGFLAGPDGEEEEVEVIDAEDLEVYLSQYAHTVREQLTETHQLALDKKDVEIAQLKNELARARDLLRERDRVIEEMQHQINRLCAENTGKEPTTPSPPRPRRVAGRSTAATTDAKTPSPIRVGRRTKTPLYRRRKRIPKRSLSGGDLKNKANETN